MRFEVPQFIDVESKIFGPFTLKQFVYLAGGVGIFYLFYRIHFLLGVLIGVPIAGFAVALAMYRPNNRPFIIMVESALKYFSSAKLYLWRKEQPKATVSEVESRIKKEGELPTPVYSPKLTGNKLRDLAWSLDIKEKIK